MRGRMAGFSLPADSAALDGLRSLVSMGSVGYYCSRVQRAEGVALPLPTFSRASLVSHVVGVLDFGSVTHPAGALGLLDLSR